MESGVENPSVPISVCTEDAESPNSALLLRDFRSEPQERKHFAEKLPIFEELLRVEASRRDTGQTFSASTQRERLSHSSRGSSIDSPTRQATSTTSEEGSTKQVVPDSEHVVGV